MMKLKKWVKVVIKIFVIIYLGVATIQLFTVHTSEKNEIGWYTCDGGLIKVCHGSRSILGE